MKRSHCWWVGTGAADRKQPPHPHYGSPPPRGSKNRYLGQFSRPVLISSGTCTCSSSSHPSFFLSMSTSLQLEVWVIRNTVHKKRRNMAYRKREINVPPHAPAQPWMVQPRTISTQNYNQVAMTNQHQEVIV